MGERTAADAVALGHGLVPGTEVTRLLRAEHRFVGNRGGWIAERDGDYRTTVEGLYVAGDGCGISGGAAAEAGQELLSHCSSKTTLLKVLTVRHL